MTDENTVALRLHETKHADIEQSTVEPTSEHIERALRYLVAESMVRNDADETIEAFVSLDLSWRKLAEMQTYQNLNDATLQHAIDLARCANDFLLTLESRLSEFHSLECKRLALEEANQ